MTLRNRRRALAACVISLAALPRAAPAEKYALLIGLNDYGYPLGGVPTLRWALGDVEEMEKALIARGYTVTSLTNKRASRDDVVSELMWHAWKLQEEDSFILYFAGHGVRDRVIGQTYWLVHQVHLDSLDVSGIRLRHLLDYIQDIRAKRKLILLDHCFSGDLVSDDDRRGPARDVSPSVRLERNAFPVSDFQQQLDAAAEPVEGGSAATEPAGTVVIAAAHEEAYELTELKHGLFTYVLLEAMTGPNADANQDTQLSVEELKTFVRSRVSELAPRHNAPQEVIESTRGVNLSRWFVADLPADPGRRADEYKLALSSWENKGWISRPTKNRCWQVLLNWADAVRQGLELGADDRNILEEIQESMDPTVAERVRADALQIAIRGLGGPP